MAAQLCVEEFVEANIKENTKLCVTGHLRFPAQRASNVEIISKSAMISWLHWFFILPAVVQFNIKFHKLWLNKML